ncbi:alpha/beta fold hydrolase [soil metagenome]
MDEAESLESYLFNRHLRQDLPPDGPAPPLPPGTETRILTDDGLSLAATIWDPAGRERRRVVVIAAATGVLRGYYAPFAAWLSARGFAVVTFDYRGMGDSRGAASAPTMREWGERDLASVVAWAARALGDGTHVAVVGHSVGGQLVGLLPEPARVSALVTVGSQSGDFRLWPLPTRLAMAVIWYGVVPGVTHAVGYLPGALGIGEDLPAGVALEWARWCRTPGYLVGAEGVSRREGFAKLAAPTLAFGFDDNAYAPRAAIDALLDLYVGARIERRQLARSEGRFGHFGFFRKRHRRLWREAASFLDRSVG